MIVISLFTIGGSFIAQVMPVNVNTFIKQPGSVFLSYYTGIGSEDLQVTLTFNDFNEVQGDVRLVITIEGEGLIIKTKKDFQPTQPISLTPGVPLTLSGPDLFPYLDLNNVELQGISYASINATGKIPEGMYNICVQAYEYNSGTEVSLPSCGMSVLSQEQPPVVLTPICGGVVETADPQIIYFNWQQGGGVDAVSALGSQYQFSLYEIINDQSNPLFAVQNGHGLLIYESPFQNENSISIDYNSVSLTPGKRYAFRIKVIDENGNNTYANNGYSEWCWFYYGYPENGTIPIVSPANNHSYTKDATQFFEWENPNNNVAGQQYEYALKIVEVNEDQDVESAIESNIPWYEHTTPGIASLNGYNHIVTNTFEPAKHYAWQVIAYTNTQEVAKSSVHSFYGPSLIDNFLAGNKWVDVISTSNNDLSALDGIAKINFSSNPDDAIEVPFNGLKIIEIAGDYVLDDGEIIFELPEVKEITIPAASDFNAPGLFTISGGVINRSGMKMNGNFKWNFPHPLLEGPTVLTTQLTTVNVIDESISGIAKFKPDSLSFKLLEPYGYQIDLDTNSTIEFGEGKYAMNLFGNLETNEHIKNIDGNNYKVKLNQVDNLTYFVATLQTEQFRPLPKLDIKLQPSSVQVDLDDNTSPGSLASDPDWKGIFAKSFKFYSGESIDPNGYIQNFVTIDQLFEASNESELYLDNRGVNFKINEEINRENTVYFNTFAGKVSGLEINIEEGQIMNSKIKGKIKVPFISDTDWFDVSTDLGANGIEGIELLTDFNGYSFVYNAEGGDQAVNISFNSGNFEGKDRLNFSANLNWEALSVNIPNAENFLLYGDNSLGFGQKNGVYPLTTQVMGNIEGYDIICEKLFAGTFDNKPIIGLDYTIDLGEDIGGTDGAPRGRALSVAEPMPTNNGPAATLNNTDTDSTPSVASTTEEEEDPNKIEFTQKFFNNLQEKNDDGKVILDSTGISINVGVASAEGFIRLTNDHPTWGASWMGHFNVDVKIPKAVSLSSTFLKGKKDNIDFWYFDFAAGMGMKNQGTGNEATDATGAATTNQTTTTATEDKKDSKLNKFNGIPLGPVLIDQIEGRVYHHMVNTSNTSIDEGVGDFNYAIDENTVFGAYLRTHMVDVATGGDGFMISGALEVSAGAYAVSRLSGEFQGSFMKDKIRVNGLYTYTEENNHHYAQLGAELEIPICASGTLTVDIDNSKTFIGIGDRDNRITVYPVCQRVVGETAEVQGQNGNNTNSPGGANSGTSTTSDTNTVDQEDGQEISYGGGFEGWIILNLENADSTGADGQQYLFLGAGVGGTVAFSSGAIKLPLITIVAKAEASLAAGIQGRIPFNENTQAMFGVWVSANASVAIDYETVAADGTIELLSVSLEGDATFEFPNPYELQAKLTGNASVLGIEVEFNVEGKHTF